MTKGRTTLGLDIGSNSIGWALIDEEKHVIVAAGSRIFPEGVDRDQTGGELSKNESRRVARGMRRQIARRARRKRLLRAALMQAGLLPTDPADQALLDQLNPYELRQKGLREKLTPHEFGRVLIHLNQRRGFLSNRKADRSKKKEASEMLQEISDLEAEIKDAGHQTLGEHLAALYAANPLGRLRGRHTHREMLLAEFEALWETQKKHHPQLLTDILKLGSRGPATYPRPPARTGGGEARWLAEFGLFGIIFFQRPMYWPKSVVGQCELDPKQKRCPRADRAAQKFRIYNEVNNLRIIAGDGEIKELSPPQREKLLKLLGQNDSVKFDEIRKALGLLENDGFNLEAGERKKLLGMPSDAVLAKGKYFGGKWHKQPEEWKNRVVRSLIHDDEATFLERARDEFKIETGIAERLLDAPLPEGYASYGRETIERLLPFVEQGLPLTAPDGQPCAIRLAGLIPVFERQVKKGQFLPEPPPITNPLVRQALYEVRKLINAIIREYGRPTAVHIELAREVKGTGDQRADRTKNMRARERLRDDAAERIKEHGEKPTRGKIELYLLWEEQNRECMYSGKPISIHQLFGGEVNIDHVLPYSKSLDDSLMNKAVCFRKENDEKGQRTVHEWLAATNPQKYDQVLQRAARLPIDIRNRKRQKFAQKTCELEQFISRQLTDTAYITSAVVEYLKALDVDVLGSKGQLTAELRHQWGLNDVLRSDGLDKKNREDHRHHAVDALVIALTDRARLQKLAKCRGQQELPVPWKTFRADVEAKINEIKVSHRVRRKVAGALHEETIYGPTPRPGEFVCRKPLESLTPAMIEDIRDPEVRRLVQDRLKQFGIDLATGQKIPKEVWKEPLLMVRKAGRVSSSPAVIKKVRLIRKDVTIRPLRGEGQFVKPGSNHHVCIFEYEDEKGKLRREPAWVSMLEAVNRLKRGESVIQRTHPERPNARFVMSISRGEMFLATIKGAERLVWFRTGASTQGQLYFVDHTDARPDKTAAKFVATANSLKARKVTVDLLGRLRWAND
ncbi:MAG: type II CRISPR RNA-guided endonuclease Cas9 [Pirellulaceae bacterium]|nr:type II CRISPR RNA-guided endonuclease Cas9 [Pirellulaceae bacterium]